MQPLRHLEKTDPRIGLNAFHSLPELLGSIIAERDLSFKTSLIDSFLHTYRLFATITLVIEAIDVKFWDVCIAEDIDVDQKFDSINTLRLLVSRWLQPPHIRDFDTSAVAGQLRFLVCTLVKWYTVVRPKSSADNSWIQRYLDDSPESQSHNFLRCMFYGADLKRLSQISQKLEHLCKFAETVLDRLPDPSRRDEEIQDLPLGVSISRPITEKKAVSKKNVTAPCDFSFLNRQSISPRKLAEEITLVDQRLFLNLLLPECLLFVRTKPSPTVQATIDQFNRIVSLVQYTILRIQPADGSFINGDGGRFSEPGATVVTGWSMSNSVKRDGIQPPNQPVEATYESHLKRVHIMTFWIDVATKLYKLNSFSALQAVVIGLQTNAIYRLRQQWNLLNSLFAQHQRKFDSLVALMSHDNNFERLRSRIKLHIELLQKIEVTRRNQKRNKKKLQSSSNSPPYQTMSGVAEVVAADKKITGMIPYLGVYFQDLTFLNYALPDFKSVGDSDRGSTRSAPQTDRPYRSPRSRLRSTDSPSPDSISSLPEMDLNSFDFKQCLRQKSADVQSGCRSCVTSPVRSQSSFPQEQSSSEEVHTSERKMINFSKHIREAAILKDLNLLQYAALNYDLKSDVAYACWLDSLPTLSEEESWQLSLNIEPEPEILKSYNEMTPTATHPKQTQVSSICSLSGESKNGRSGVLTAPSDSSNLKFSRSLSELTLNVSETVSSSTNLPNPSRQQPSIVCLSSPRQSRRSSHPASPFSANIHKCRKPTLAPPLPRSARSVSRTKDSRSRRQSRSNRKIAIHVTMLNTLSAVGQLFVPNFLKQAAKLGSIPNVAFAPKDASPHPCSTTFYVSEEDTISDLLARVLSEFGIPLLLVAEYDLVQVCPGMPDRILPVQESISRAFLVPSSPSRVPVTWDTIKPISCVCVKRISSASTFSGFGRRRKTKVTENRSLTHSRDRRRGSFASLFTVKL